ncbi:hypothetical protein OJF2_38660 [Aquisphaera giovannonii]|uniref:EthD domain-containing protein n=1 Tax=Aquisphaera giovannonii TaxID=406548 RepID=A0A5B9W569_9BACT|nr:hypothetical protein [Aquisphaera giovannonii]QEH35315.1 hypothetical protein OJF2_38660 [Aquisphaera giovannonii]
MTGPTPVARKWTRVSSILLVASAMVVQPASSPAADEPAERPYVLECYYKAKWGKADEFIRLFKKNHYPVLRALEKEGRLLKITAVKPRYHGTEDGRWDYRVTLVFKNPAAAFDSEHEEAIKKRLFPDQEAFLREEQLRFEILDAHWDVPTLDLDLDR